VLPTLAIALLMPAAPVPKVTERQKVEQLFGKIVDPKGDCEFKLNGDHLSVTLPANAPKYLNHEGDNVPKVAPKLGRAVKGDFAVTVRVAVTLGKEAKSGGKSELAYLGGGIQVRSKDGTWARICYSNNVFKGRDRPGYGCEAPPNIKAFGYCDTAHINDSIKAGQDLYVRLIRRENRLEFATSIDAKEWHTPMTAEFNLPDECTVFLYATHSSDKARTVTFSEFKVTPPPKEE
jgi:regulation of enolase protein 1 (concanavalin A-like superfamily)